MKKIARPTKAPARRELRSNQKVWLRYAATRKFGYAVTRKFDYGVTRKFGYATQQPESLATPEAAKSP